MLSLEEFYSDERRRESREVRLGDGWRDARNELFGFAVFWLAETEELCLLRAPLRGVVPYGDYVNIWDPFPTHAEVQKLGDRDVTVEVLASISIDELNDLNDQWPAHVNDEDGIGWLRSQLSPSVNRD